MPLSGNMRRRGEPQNEKLRFVLNLVLLYELAGITNILEKNDNFDRMLHKKYGIVHKNFTLTSVFLC